MDLIETLRTTGAVRDFLPDAVPDDVVHRILDNARFAPSGGNRQGWRAIVVKDPAIRRRIRDLYLDGWYAYLAQVQAGVTPFAAVTDRAAEARAVEHADEIRSAAAAGSGGFAEHIHEVPVLIVVLADLRALAAVDRDLDRYTLVGGASIYPFVWSVLLAARVEGLAGVMTTMPILREPELKAVLGVPDDLAVAAVVALGRPTRTFRRLTRAAVEDFTTVDRADGTPFAPG